MELAKQFLEFVNASPTPFHAVEQVSRRLKSAGFERLTETSQWSLLPSGKYFFSRNSSTLLAFCIGKKFKPGNGFNILGAHTDSPVLKIKPISKTSSNGCLQVGVEPYGGGLWHTWFDRDLGLAGRLILNKGGKMEQKLIHIDRPILRIPNLAIHLDRSVKEGFKFNDQTHLLPVLTTLINQQLEDKTSSNSNENTTDSGRHHKVFLSALANEAKCEVNEISELELLLCDTQPAQIGGLFGNEFILSPRLDNLLSSFAAIEALTRATSSEDFLNDEERVSVVALFDNEEVGSDSERGAGSTLIEALIKRVTFSTKTAENNSNVNLENWGQWAERAMRRSYLISADMAHAVHPNYSEKHEPLHRPLMNSGIVLKNNANQRYATHPPTSALIRLLASKNDIPLQEFVVRNDTMCGSTIGPILSTFGLRAIDIGAPQWSMHSIRETCAVKDLEFYEKLMFSFFQQITLLDESFSVDS